MEDLRRSLLAALAFFDMFDYPLTLAELARFRYRPRGVSGSGATAPAAAMLEALATPAVGERDGYYFLAGREAIVAARLRRYRLAERKFAKAVRAARFLRLLPSVRAVAVCNSLALSNAGDESDIDIFIICAPGTLWVTRLAAVGWLALAGKRPSAARSADTYCLSFFLSEAALGLRGVALPEGDAYLRYWIASLVPIYDAGGVMERFRRANAWANDAAALPPYAASARRSAGAMPRWYGSAVRVLRLFDRPAEKLQLRVMPPKLRSIANADSRVVLSPAMLKFHADDRRQFFERRFRERIEALERSAERQPSL